MPRSMPAACSVLAAILLSGCSSMSIREEPFGRSDGMPVSLYTLTCAGMTAKITNYGGIVTELHVPDREGRTADVVLGFDTLDEYRDHNPYFGAMVGRCANRIAEGRFTLDGRTYLLATNNGPNHLHGGVKGWDKVVWEATPRETPDGPALELRYFSPDGEEGYPGDVSTTVVYTLTRDRELRIDVEATCTAPTPVNVVHHSYWNLAGHSAGTILDHELTLDCDAYTPTDATLIPTGEIAPVEGTPFDFRAGKTIGTHIADVPSAGGPGGYDLNYVVRGEMGTIRRAARVRDPGSGRVMEIWTTEPGIQFYTGNFLDGVSGKGGAVYPKHGAFCLETQRYPDAMNKEGREGWPTVVLRPGQTYRHTMIHRFGTD